MGLVARPPRNEELGKFLLSRRVRLSAESSGLPVLRSRRRTPGLRREDVSSIAGISTAYYAWIEQGRPFDISADVLYAIAGALQLSDVETSYIFLLGGKAEVRPKSPQAPPWSDDIMQVVTGFESGPALALTSWLDVLGVNAIAKELFEFEPGTNLAWWLFCAKGVRVKPCNCNDVSVALVALLRRNRARESDPRQFSELIERLRAESHDFALLWDGHVVDSSPLVDVEFDRPAEGRIAYRAMLLCDCVASRQFVILMTPIPNR
ncbi:MAG TPA: helix-turn-helix domain-containing protein [Candidatus Baltobacteraceae bacterium]|jgi:transcriptional regulator with XRE-family HTH domain